MSRNHLRLPSNSLITLPERNGRGNFKAIGADQLLDKMNAYFDDANAQKEPYNAYQLAFSLGLTFEQFRGMEGILQSPENRELVKKALALCEADAAQRLIKGKPPIGLIFYLKNAFNWKDKREEERTFNIRVERIRYNTKRTKQAKIIIA